MGNFIEYNFIDHRDDIYPTNGIPASYEGGEAGPGGPPQPAGDAPRGGSGEMTFLDVWIGYAAIGTTIFSVVFVWAVRTRQFTEMDRQRHIPLRSAEIGGEQRASRTVPRVDCLVLAALIVTVFGMLIWGIVAGMTYAVTCNHNWWAVTGWRLRILTPKS